jgi:hypothetical protein
MQVRPKPKVFSHFELKFDHIDVKGFLGMVSNKTSVCLRHSWFNSGVVGWAFGTETDWLTQTEDVINKLFC